MVTGSPVVELNRAVAVAQAYGPAAGLEIVDGLREHRALRDYHLLPSVRGELLTSLGRTDEARAEYRPGGGAGHQRAGTRPAPPARRRLTAAGSSRR